jgi:SAM-dependent methyltransferase
MDEPQDMQFFYTVFEPSFPRLGPGDDGLTLWALEYLLSHAPVGGGGRAGEKLRVLEIGCGNGPQTIQLAAHVVGTICAVDNHEPYLTEMMRRARAAGVAEKVKPCLKDMRDLAASNERYDLVWAEGSLFVMGFAEGIALCHELLRPGGVAAVSDAVWLRPDAPAECREYFAGIYPAMADIDAQADIIRGSGFALLEQRVFPESAWWEGYYLPLERRLELLRAENSGDPARLEMLDWIQAEIEMYRKYPEYYGNALFLIKRG